MEKNLKNYFYGEAPICREERQFALFLYNCLIFNDKEIVKELLGEGSVVEEVYYEVTFMRDFFEHSRKDISKKEISNNMSAKDIKSNKDNFNALLIDYICQNNVVPISGEYYEYRNLGHSHINENNVIDDWARLMMNAKPDIGVLYKKESGWDKTQLHKQKRQDFE